MDTGHRFWEGAKVDPMGAFFGVLVVLIFALAVAFYLEGRFKRSFLKWLSNRRPHERALVWIACWAFVVIVAYLNYLTGFLNAFFAILMALLPPIGWAIHSFGASMARQQEIEKQAKQSGTAETTQPVPAVQKTVDDKINDLLDRNRR